MRNGSLIGFAILTILIGTVALNQASSAPSQNRHPAEDAIDLGSTLVENGGFERPDVDSYAFFSERIPGWTIIHDGVEIIDASYGHGFRVRSGNQLVDLSGSGAISQAVPTDPGSPYCLVFHLYREPDAPAPSTLTVEAGEVRETLQDHAGAKRVSARGAAFRRRIRRRGDSYHLHQHNR